MMVVFGVVEERMLVIMVILVVCQDLLLLQILEEANLLTLLFLHRQAIQSLIIYAASELLTSLDGSLLSTNVVVR